MHENTIPPKVMCPNVTKKEKKKESKKLAGIFSFVRGIQECLRSFLIV